MTFPCDAMQHTRLGGGQSAFASKDAADSGVVCDLSKLPAVAVRLSRAGRSDLHLDQV
jgi:hypothetical protein